MLLFLNRVTGTFQYKCIHLFYLTCESESSDMSTVVCWIATQRIVLWPTVDSFPQVCLCCDRIKSSTRHHINIEFQLKVSQNLSFCILMNTYPYFTSWQYQLPFHIFMPARPKKWTLSLHVNKVNLCSDKNGCLGVFYHHIRQDTHPFSHVYTSFFLKNLQVKKQ